MNVIINFGNSKIPYFYVLNEFFGNTAIISKDNVSHELILTSHGWKIIGINQPHSIKFQNIGTLDECDTLYSEYKFSCSKYWDTWIKPYQDAVYYTNIIITLLKCLNGRSKHHYTCQDSIDESHAGALRKIEEKIITAKLLYMQSFIKNTKDDNISLYNRKLNNIYQSNISLLIDNILVYNKDKIREWWFQLLGKIDKQLNTLDIVNLEYALSTYPN